MSLPRLVSDDEPRESRSLDRPNLSSLAIEKVNGYGDRLSEAKNKEESSWGLVVSRTEGELTLQGDMECRGVRSSAMEQALDAAMLALFTGMRLGLSATGFGKTRVGWRVGPREIRSGGQAFNGSDSSSGLVTDGIEDSWGDEEWLLKLHDWLLGRESLQIGVWAGAWPSSLKDKSSRGTTVEACGTLSSVVEPERSPIVFTAYELGLLIGSWAEDGMVVCDCTRCSREGNRGLPTVLDNGEIWGGEKQERVSLALNDLDIGSEFICWGDILIELLRVSTSTENSTQR